MFERVALIVLDSVGIGQAPDAEAFGDSGADTLGNTSRAVGGLSLPHLGRLGLGRLSDLSGVPPELSPTGAFGCLEPRSAGKDTTTGHWELAGLVLDKPFALFPDGFPREILEPFEERTGRGTLGNVPMSGTEIIDRLGEEHLATGKLIVYTSGDSVFQIAAHEEEVPIAELYRACEIAREILDSYSVGRVIARPFLGERSGAFHRTARRRDFSLQPPSPTVLRKIHDHGLPVVGIGKICDIFAGDGISEKVSTANNDEGVARTLEALERPGRGVIMTNLVDFDVCFGHRRDPAGYARCLEAFDTHVPDLLAALGPDDLLILTADHGNDPTHHGTDHTRERVPLLVAGPRVAAGTDLGTGSTFADVGATLAEIFGVEPPCPGTSFLPRIAPNEKHGNS